ncbi:MAG: DUF3025 domain-containing protein [Gammaproteobacteria bacterium]|nr:DUF3025 domain-containing protein [Gammaproteobacteria bacterium]
MNKPRATPGQHSIDLNMPCWEGYQEALLELFGESVATTKLPDVAALQSLLCPTVSNLQGQAIQFVSPSSLPAGNYEENIFTTGKVSTRPNNWHDVFNALVWWRFPALKAAMNAIHYAEQQKQSGSGRGTLRDALTLWDECGIIVASAHGRVLETLANRNWQGAFQDFAHLWRNDVRVFICGHALLEKFLDPYKAITAHALLVQIDPDSFAVGRENLQKDLDRALAAKLVQGDLIKSTAYLSPLPLAGVPGWWTSGEQDDEFYADTAVFRTPASPIVPAPVFKMDLH